MLLWFGTMLSWYGRMLRNIVPNQSVLGQCYFVWGYTTSILSHSIVPDFGLCYLGLGTFLGSNVPTGTLLFFLGQCYPGWDNITVALSLMGLCYIFFGTMLPGLGQYYRSIVPLGTLLFLGTFRLTLRY